MVRERMKGVIRMEQLPMRQILGMKDLIQDTIEATVIAIAKAHQDIAHLPYAVLEQIDPIAAPVRTIEHVQQTITDEVYYAIRVVNQIVGTAAAHVLEQL